MTPILFFCVLMFPGTVPLHGKCNVQKSMLYFEHVSKQGNKTSGWRSMKGCKLSGKGEVQIKCKK
jgi:hypothetical protein